MSKKAAIQIVDYTESAPPPPPSAKKAVLLFWAPWHEDSAEGGSWDRVLRVLADSTADEETIAFGRVQAEDCAVLCRKYGVSVVPTFVLLDGTSNDGVFERIEGGEDVATVTQAVQRLIQQQSPEDDGKTTTSSDNSNNSKSAEEEKEKQKQKLLLSARLDRLIHGSEVMLFLKGTPDSPKCGFSRQIVELLQEESIAFGSFDILQDEQVRQGLKTHSDWPTYPQLYCRGELVGGLDIVKEMKENNGSLRQELGLGSAEAAAAAAAVAPVKSLDERLGELVRREPIMLFMKGLPSAPQCGFSRQMVEILDGLNDGGVAYGAFNILEDEEVRQGLKTYSDWPTFPQLYANGELIGGLDIVKEMEEEGVLREALSGGSQ